jgi:hypothetical protein
MELKNVNLNGNNVIASNLNNIDFFLENCENWVKKQTSYVIFSTRCYDFPQNKILHIAHLTNQYWMNQSFSGKYGPILQEKIS